MYIRLIVVSIGLALSACSSGGGSGNGGSNNNGGGGATFETKAGVWQGDLGFGAGTYIIDNNNNLYGLASTDGAAYHSIFGNLGAGDSYSGGLDVHFHPASNAIKGSAFAPQGEDVDTTNFNLNIVNGQTIESLDTNNPFTLTYATTGLAQAATTSSVAGNWSGVHSFCTTATDCQEFTIDLNFSGSSFSGETGVASLPIGENVFPGTITGTVTEFGSVLLTQYTWESRALSGVIYFDANGNLILNGDSPSEQTISSKLGR